MNPPMLPAQPLAPLWKKHVPCAECGAAWAIWTALSVVTIPIALIAAAITNIAIVIDIFNSKS